MPNHHETDPAGNHRESAPAPSRQRKSAEPSSDETVALNSIAVGSTDDPSSAGTTDGTPASHRSARTSTLSIPGYEVLEEIARGGMGVVYAARDITLDRAVAIKVMLLEQMTPDKGDRFATEARITACLAHPGIPPVHALGRLPNGSPFLAMKQIRGATLSQHLKRRSRPLEDQDRWIHVFEQICQAVAFAHQRDIIHRDLKPANIMVGEFGEVKVMDWGLAKRLLKEPPHPSESLSDRQVDEANVAETSQDLSATLFLDPDTEPAPMTKDGQVMGTFAYMPPEQARGELSCINSSSDVFALGAILCEILTGFPAYRGSRAEDLWNKARTADLDEALTRLAKCPADIELVTLANDCLAAEPELRPSDAAELLNRIQVYNHTVRQRLEQAQADRVAAVVRANEERKRRWTAVVSLVSLLLLTIVLGATGFFYQARESRIRERHTRLEGELDQQLRLATQTLDSLHKDLADPVQAIELPTTPSLWAGRLTIARGLLAQAEGLHQATERQVNPSLLEHLATVRSMLKQDESDRETVARLEDLQSWARERTVIDDEVVFLPVTANYEAEFRQAGLDIERGEAREVAEKIRLRHLRWFWVDALDRFAGNADTPKRLQMKALEIARNADPDPWRDRLRSVLTWTDREQLELLASDPVSHLQPPVFVVTLSRQLLRKGGRAPQLLRVTLALHPRNYGLLTNLAHTGEDIIEEIGCLRTAIVLRPNRAQTYHELGGKLDYLDQQEEAIASYRRAIELDPDYWMADYRLAAIFKERGNTKEAIAAYRRVAAIVPGTHVHATLGYLLIQTGNPREAITFLSQAASYFDSSAAVHFNLGVALSMDGQFAKAANSLARALELYPEDHEHHQSVTRLLHRCELLKALEPVLPSLLAGSRPTSNGTEALALAQYCVEFRKDYSNAARFYAIAFQQVPEMETERKVDHFLTAARVALQAANGEGTGETPDADRSLALRRQALTLARQSLALLRESAADTSKSRTHARESLSMLEQDACFRPFREEAALDQWTTDERRDWRELWEFARLTHQEMDSRDQHPFHIVGRGGQGNQRYATLDEALSSASGDDVIEIHGDGPYFSKPIKVERKDVTIRSARGWLPSLRFRGVDSGLQTGESFLSFSHASITLQGLEFFIDGGPRDAAYNPIIGTFGSDLLVEGCRFRYVGPKGKFTPIYGLGISNARVSSSEFDGPFVTGVYVIPAANANVIVENCLFTGPMRIAVTTEAYYPSSQSARVSLLHNTFANSGSAVDVRINAGDDGESEPATDEGLIEIHSTENVFSGRDCAVLVTYLESRPQIAPSPEKGAELLRRLYQWRDQGNLYAKSIPIVDIIYGNAKPGGWFTGETQRETLAADLETWQQFWGFAASVSHEEFVTFRGGSGDDLRALQLSIGADAFLLHEETRNALTKAGGTMNCGISEGLVGPGTAFERWNAIESASPASHLK